MRQIEVLAGHVDGGALSRSIDCIGRVFLVRLPACSAQGMSKVTEYRCAAGGTNDRLLDVRAKQLIDLISELTWKAKQMTALLGCGR